MNLHTCPYVKLAEATFPRESLWHIFPVASFPPSPVPHPTHTPPLTLKTKIKSRPFNQDLRHKNSRKMICLQRSGRSRKINRASFFLLCLGMGADGFGSPRWWGFFLRFSFLSLYFFQGSLCKLPQWGGKRLPALEKELREGALA